MDIKLFKLFIFLRSYCYTCVHSCIYHVHTTSEHVHCQLWIVASCRIVMIFATLGRSHFIKKTKKSLVNSLLSGSCSVVFDADWGDDVKTFPAVIKMFLLKQYCLSNFLLFKKNQITPQLFVTVFV